jgi:threonine/homoserine/homoserine lactone efflux protein
LDVTLWLAYIVAAGALLFLPGPDWAFMLANGARQRRTAPGVTGLTMGYVILALVVALGIGPLVTAVPVALVVIACAGAVYLIVLGTKVIRTPRTESYDSDLPHQSKNPQTSRDTTRQLWRSIRQGIGVSSLNVKSLVLFVAFLPQFVSSSAAWPIWTQLAVLGLTWAGLGAIFYSLLGSTSKRLLGNRPGIAHTMTRITGAAMVIMGVLLATEQIVHLANHTA